MHEKSTIVRITVPLARILSRIAPGLAARLLEHLLLRPMRFKRPWRERLWVASAEQKTVAFDEQRRLHLLSWGSGPTVLLVHGWAGRGSQLGALAAPLVAAGYRVVAFDAPAHGDSDGRLTGLPELAAAVGRVADHLGPVYAVVAHSLGTVATTIALSRGLSVERLVYIAPPAHPFDWPEKMARLLGFSEEVLSRTWARFERRFGFRSQDADLTALADQMTTPLVVVHDEADREVPLAEGALLCEAWPDAALVTTHGLGHRRILRAPETVDLIVGVLGIKQPRTWRRLTLEQASA